MLCEKEPSADELPYWETINRYLERLDPEKLQEAIHCLCRRLLRSRAFEDTRVRGNTGRLLSMGHSFTAPGRNWTGRACTEHITEGPKENAARTIIMC